MPQLAQDFSSRYGPWALIAGASEGLGAAFAECLAAQGINLILVARRAEPLETLAVRLRETHAVDVMTQSLDLANEEALVSFMGTLDADLGLIICNAAYSAVGGFLETPAEQLKQIIGVNVTAPLLITRLLAPRLLTRGRGGVILMSSLAGNQGSANIATYAASKSFNTVLAEGLWQELKRAGIDVVAPCAGAIRTPGYQQAASGPEPPGTMDADEVASQALAALGHRPVVVPGRFNQFALFLMRRLMPRKTAIRLMSSSTKGLSS
ncbi:MAG: SDR family NAD(P)-dependent oxidoreductase [Halieaceae bacterium]